MKRFLAIYIGSSSKGAKWSRLDEEAQRERVSEGMSAWTKWGETNSQSIVDRGSPLGKTKKVDNSGVSDIKNSMTAYTIVEAESHEAAAKIFLNHPHFSVFPGDSVEIMECLPIPEV